MLKNIFVLLISLALFSSCVVSKKKYEALMLEKNNVSDQLSEKKKENKELQSDLDQAVLDFETIKSDFAKSNALRSDEIADLMIKVTQLADESEELNSKLKETVGKFKAKEKAGYMAEEELKSTLLLISALKRDTANLNYTLTQAKKRSVSLQQELMDSKTKLSELKKSEYDTVKAMELQEKSVKEMEQKLVKSQQNISDISKAFIELRKELLSAKSNNKSLDPNKSATINRIAKLLGHY
jgi:chromosome segregation ATPase